MAVGVVFEDEVPQPPARATTRACASTHGNLGPFCTLTEEVSHFLYLLFCARSSRTVTELELELQGEVDKYLTAAFFLSLQNEGAVSSAAAAAAVPRATTSPKGSPRSRPSATATASQLAFHYCGYLEAEYLRPQRLPDLARASRGASTAWASARSSSASRASTDLRAPGLRSGAGRDAMRIGVDLGGTKIEAVALADDGRDAGPAPRADTARRLRGHARGDRPARRGASKPKTGAQGVRRGGHAGRRSRPPRAGIKNANSTWLNGRPLQQDLERRLARPVRLANDANCFALSEARDGAGAGARVVFGVILGTGTGGGVVVDGRVLTRPERHRRRVGPQPAALADRGIEWPGPRCYCGRTGCWSCSSRARDSHASISASTGETARGGGHRPQEAAAGDEGVPRARSRPTRAAWPAAWPWSSTCSIPTWSCWAAASPTSTWLYRGVPELWRDFVFSDRVDTRARPAACTATRRGCAAPPGSGRRTKPLDGPPSGQPAAASPARGRGARGAR